MIKSDVWGAGVTPQNRTKLESRVIRAAEAALADHRYVSAPDMLMGMGLLNPRHFENWRAGRVDYLERVVQGDLNKISDSMRLFRKWASEMGLKPSETRFMHKSHPLRFSKSGNDAIEAAYRTVYLSPELSEKKQQKVAEKLTRETDTLVFQILRDSQCERCGQELGRGRFLTLEAESASCMKCAGLDDLEFLPRGNAGLTRRAAKYSERKAVVVRFSRTRNRYERQGVLLERQALERASEEVVGPVGFEPTTNGL